MAFPDLEKDFKTAAELDKLEPLSGYDDALHQSQADDLSSEGSQKTKRFFDYMALHVLIPCINALNRAVLALKGNTSTSLENLEKKLTALSGDTTTSVEALEERVKSVEKVSSVSTAKVEAATELAKAAAENVMQKDQCASVMNLITGQPMYFGRGSKEEVDESIPVAPGETVYFEEDDVDYETLVKHPQNTENPHGVTCKQIGAAPDGYGLGSAKKITAAELDSFCSPGWFYISEESITIGGVTANYWFGYTESLGNGKVHSVQHIRGINGGVYNEQIRKNYKGNWGEWEWLNPPMQSGVEYRTTERCLGRPVFRKLVRYSVNAELGDSNGVTDLKIPTKINETFTILRCSALAGSGLIFPYTDSGGGETKVIKVNNTDGIVVRMNKAVWAKKERLFSFDLAYIKKDLKEYV